MIDIKKAALLGFSPQLVRTWDTELPRAPRLLVPVHLDALVVRSERTGWADCRMRTPEEAGSTRSFDLLPPPFADREQSRPLGAHLHWAMPDALTKLTGGGISPDPQVLPDRWLIARLSPGKLRRRVRSWIVDSRRQTAMDLEQWVSGTREGKPVTPLGIGDAGWAAYYDNVVNRFAFHDPLDDVAEGPVSYLVCGWYADTNDDPLANNTRTLAAFQARLEALRWHLDPSELHAVQARSHTLSKKATTAGLQTLEATRDETGRVLTAKPVAPFGAKGFPLGGSYQMPEPYWPQQTLMHGSVIGISWPRLRDGSPEVGSPSAAGVKVAIGTTPADALGALIGASSGNKDIAEWLTAFALGAVEELSHPDGDTRIADRLHDGAFVARTDGTETVRRAASTLDQRPKQSKRASKAQATGRRRGKVPLDAHARRQDSKKTRWTARELRDIHVRSPERDRPDEPSEIVLPRPRLFQPADPVIAILGALRSPKHGGDGAFSEDGQLDCRLSTTQVRSISVRIKEDATRRTLRAPEILDRALHHGAIPPECNDLLEEFALLDVASAPTIAGVLRAKAPPDAVGEAKLSERVVAEQTAWWATRSPRADAAALLGYSGLEGRLPSPLAVRPAAGPWVPLHLDWEVEVIPAPARHWTPGEIDFDPPEVPQQRGETLSGRSLLDPGTAKALAETVRNYIEHEAAAEKNGLADADAEDELTDLASRLEQIDVLSGVLERFHSRLRRDGQADAEDSPPPVAMRSGFLRVRRLRLVDAFGQALYLAGSDADTDVDPQSISVGAGGAVTEPGILALPPRFTAPSKIEFRFRSAQNRAVDATEDKSPILGWLLPDHIDGALEVFDPNGHAHGQLLLDPQHGTVWEPAPGRTAAVGESPRSVIQSAELADLAQALFEFGPRDVNGGRVPALAELLRVVDTTRWTIDPFGHTGEEHLALLVGHPVAVVAASVMVDVREPLAGTDVPVTRVPVRLGSLPHWQDGLFGYFVDGRFGSFKASLAAAKLARPAAWDGFLGAVGTVPEYCAAFADDVNEEGDGATPIEHPYVDPSGILWVVPGVRHELVLLMEPHCVVHATTCLLPRKQLGVRREWMAPALRTMAPTFRFGPVLRDPKQIRMPIAADVGGAWTWTHRADVDRWAEEEVVHSGQEALLSPDPSVATEGWLKLTPKPKDEA